jgi:hypothetical protein
MSIESKFIQAKVTPSDINEHIQTFYDYAKNVSHVTELGVRWIVSSWGFLYGLHHSTESEKRLVSVDLKWHPNIIELQRLAQENQISYSFVEGDSAKVDIEPTDILFIDTWHIYGHLKRELEKHHTQVKQYIMMHDTTVDEFQGETIRCGWNPYQQSKESGYPVEEITKGLSYAIEEFLVAHPEWVLEKKYTHNNGLTILKRI